MKRLFRTVIPVALSLLACTRETPSSSDYSGEGVSFAIMDMRKPDLPETRVGRNVPSRLESADGMAVFVHAEEMVDYPTRASARHSVSNISSFTVTAFDHAGNFGPGTVSQDGGKGFANTVFSITDDGTDYWGVPASVKFWPISSRRMSFFACVPDNVASIPLGTGFPSFTYTVPDATGSQQDLLVASALDQVNAVVSQGTPGRAPLTFSHALSAVVFSIGDMGLNSDAGSLTVTLTGLYNQDTFTFNGTSSLSSPGGSWSGSPAGSGTYTFTTNIHGTDASPVEYSSMAGSAVLFLMPQAIPDGALLSISYTDPGGAEHLFSAQLNTLGITAMDPGSLYRYTISLSNRPAALQVAYQPWVHVDNETVTEDGPVHSYVAGETFGVYALDADKRIVFANVPMTAETSASTTTLNPGNHYLSSTYTYYVYYPYKAGLSLTYRDSGVALVPGNVLSTAVTGLSGLPNAYNFFTNYITGSNGNTGFTRVAAQSSLSDYKASDLQIGRAGYYDGGIFVAEMTHRMSLAKIVLQTESVPENLVFDGRTNVSTSGSSVSVTPVAAFSTASPNVTPYHDAGTDNYYYIMHYNGIPQVADGSASGTAKHLKWADSPITIRNSSGSGLGMGKYKEVVVRSRAASRGWVSYQVNYPYNAEKKAMAFTPLVDGTYRFECWGAQGGGHDALAPYGKGAYTKGEMAVTTAQTLYVYVGEYGGDEVYSNSAPSSTRTWNGGGGSSRLMYDPPRKTENHAGGGATDIRTASGNWNANLGTRIMVAGGGGGASHGGFGGYGGAPNGGMGLRYADLPDYDYDEPRYSVADDCRGKGGTGSAGGAAGHWNWSTGIAPTAGGSTVSGQVQSQGGDGNTAYGGGGGGGYWGGGGAGVYSASMGGGGGGSSYISSDFTNRQMIAGGAYTVTTKVFQGSPNPGSSISVNVPGAVSQPQPDGTTASGHAGYGYARITLLSE